MHEALYEDGVRVYALNDPAFGENAATLDAFKNQAGITYPVLYHGGTLFKVSFPGDNGFPYPKDAIVDQDGVIVYASSDYDAQGMWDVVLGLLEAAE